MAEMPILSNAPRATKRLVLLLNSLHPIPSNYGKIAKSRCIGNSVRLELERLKAKYQSCIIDQSRRAVRPVHYSYLVYGLRISVNLPILRLKESPTLSAAKIRVTLGQQPHWLNDTPSLEEEIFYRSSETDQQGIPRVVIWKSLIRHYFRFKYGDGAQFLVDKHGTRVWGTWSGNLTLEDALVYLLGPIMGFVLRERGFTCLHASAVAIDNQAIVIAGPPGNGKSTMAAAFAGLGYSVLSDDIVPLLETGNSFSVQSGYPCLCLWPESVKSLYGSQEALPLLTPTWEKRYLLLGDGSHSFQRKPLPLAAVYILGCRGAQSGRPFVEPIQGEEAFMEVLSNGYMNYLLDTGKQGRQFEMLSRLVTKLPVRRIQPHTDMSQLKRICEIVVDDFQTSAIAGQPKHMRHQNHNR